MLIPRGWLLLRRSGGLCHREHPPRPLDSCKRQAMCKPEFVEKYASIIVQITFFWRGSLNQHNLQCGWSI